MNEKLTRNPEGRPSEYKVEFCVIAHKLCQAGATDLEIAQAIDISKTTFYRWRHEYPEFREALKLGKESADDRVEMSLYRRAIGYEQETIKIMQYEGEVIVHPYIEFVQPDVGAAKLWLTNRRGEVWRDKVDVSNTLNFVDKLDADELTRLNDAINAVTAGRLPPSTEP